MSDYKNLQKYAWINCREDWDDSFALGDVVIEDVHVLENAGERHRLKNEVVGKISHGKKVSILGKEIIEHNGNQIVYLKVSDEILTGWINESFLAWNWSSFTFIGNIKPADVCKNLHINLYRWGINLLIRDNGIAVLTEGDPKQFEIINQAILRFVNRIIHAQAPLTQISLQVEFVNWVEVPLGGNENKFKSVGFTLLENLNAKTISDSDIQSAFSALPLIELTPYFDLALSDFHQALQYPEHALIFLSRAIESIENHFAMLVKQNNKGKEVLMRELLNIDKNDVDYVTRRANASHRRHASRDATIDTLSSEELAECFHKTAKILSAFAEFVGPINS